MRPSKAAFLAIVLALAVPVVLLARQNILLNGSMESGQGASALDPKYADQWTFFGKNVERSDTVNLDPNGAGHALKAFGDSASSTAGAQQDVLNVTATQNVTASVSLYTPGFDKLGGSGQAGLVLEFLNQYGGIISPIYEVYPLNASSSANTWIPATIGPLAAPATTVKVRVLCKLNWSPGDVSGAAYWDSARLTVGSDPNNKVANGNFETVGHSTGQSAVGIDDWNGFNDQEKSSTVAKDGLASLKLGVREAYSGLYQDMGTLQDGDHLLMKGFVWNPSADPLTDTSRVGLKLEFPQTIPPAVENLAFDANAPANAWMLVQLAALTVPPDVTIARVDCILAADALTTGAVYFDAAYAERSSAPGSNQLLNASFESGFGGPNGIDDWTEFGTDVATTRLSCFAVPTIDGDCTARSAGTTYTGIYQEFPVTAGETVTFWAYLYTRSDNKLGGINSKAGVKIEWILGTVPPPVDIGGSSNTVLAGAATNTWLPVSIDYTMPTGSNAMTRFTCLIDKSAATSGHAYFDSCEAVVLNHLDGSDYFNGSDYDNDDDEDLIDAAQFQLHFTGAIGPLPWNGTVFDYNDDGLINSADFAHFAPRMTGPH
jgi:hypothetical protein